MMVFYDVKHVHAYFMAYKNMQFFTLQNVVINNDVITMTCKSGNVDYFLWYYDYK